MRKHSSSMSVGSTAPATPQSVAQLSHAIRERRKELAALHGLSRRLLRDELRDPEAMVDIVAELLMVAFQWPELTAVRVIFGGAQYASPNFAAAELANVLPLTTMWRTPTGDEARIDVRYTEAVTDASEGPWLAEERDLIESMADMVRVASERIRMDAIRRMADDSQRLADLRLQVAVDAAQVGIFDWDLATDQAIISPRICEIFAFPSDTTVVTALDVRARIHPEDRDEVRRAFVAERHGESSRVLEYRLLLPNTAIRWISVRGRTFTDTSGRVTRRIAVVTDVTERYHLELQARQAQKMEAVGLLAGGVAHDFNNLLTVISASTEFAEQLTPSDSPAQEDLREIRATVGRARALTSQLLTFSRRQVVRLSRVDVSDVVQRAESLVRRIAGPDTLLHCTLSHDLPPVLGDVTMLEQVVVNLVVNARDAMPHGGSISITSALVMVDETMLAFQSGLTTGQFVLLTVSDTGIGMDEATRARIFEPFFTTKAVGRGTGLGLSTVFGIVSRLGGHIVVYSEAGIGTAFKIYLPLAPSEFETTSVSVPISSPTAGGHETILVVDDEPQVRALVRRILLAAGYRVLDAGTAAEAIDVMSQEDSSVDLVLSDVVMPGLNGRELADILRETAPSTRVLFMSGFTADALLYHQLGEAGAEVIEKPFTRLGLITAVRRAVETGARQHHQ